MTDEPMELQHFISTNSDRPCEPFTRRDIIKSILVIGGGTRDYDFRTAYRYLGGFGFRARKKAVRVKIIREAESIAEEVGHGNKPVPFQPFRLILPPRIAVIVREKFPGWL